MIKDGIVVFPGEKIATTEELLSGQGTHKMKGTIVSGILGNVHINRNTMSAEVSPLTKTPESLRNGDIVLVEIKKTTKSMVLVDIIHVAGKHRALFNEKIATIHISNLSREYVSATNEKYRIGDIARAKVIQVHPSIKLSTVGPDLGVIKAFCVNCRNVLDKKEKGFECPICGRTDTRKTAKDYGQGNMDQR
jgi:exosome complex component CSL4